MSTSGGPIDKIEYRKILIENKCYFEVYTFLKEALLFKDMPQFHIYGSATGTGTDPNFFRSCNKSISESLERWAYMALVGSGDYGFDREPTTTGLSAYPSCFLRNAREIALSEACERWLIATWWEQGYPFDILTEVNYQYVVLKLPAFERVAVIASFKNSNINTYGFGCGKTLKLAQAKALVELYRNRDVLKQYDAKKPVDTEKLGRHEKRLKYFSTMEGKELYEKRLSEVRTGATLVPELIVNVEVKGPWSKYCKMWRCLLGPTPKAHLDVSLYKHILF